MEIRISKRSNTSRLGIIAAFAAIYGIWGTTYLAIAIGVETIPPFLLMGVRSVAGGLVLVAWAKATRTPWPPGRIWLWAALCGLLFFVGCHGVLAFAEQRIPSGLAAVLLATIPFWLVILNAIFARRRPIRIATHLALIPGLAGVAFIAWGQLEHEQGSFGLPDVVFVLAAALSWAAGSLLSQRHSETTSTVMLSGLELALGGLVLLAVSVLSGNFRTFDPGVVSPASGMALAYLTFAGTVLGFASYIWLLDRVSETLVSTFTFVNPIIAVLAGWLVLGEQPTLSDLLGAALVVGSIVAVLATRADDKRP